MAKNKRIQLTEGSHYLIKSLCTRDEALETRGYFEGYLQLGKYQAVIIKLDDSNEKEGEKRIIPCHMISSIDIIDQAEPEDEDKKDTGSYFG
ncbi:MAG: hypothetical protein ACOCTR_05020 [Candidatus Natronoplasma sp.]